MPTNEHSNQIHVLRAAPGLARINVKTIHVEIVRYICIDNYPLQNIATMIQCTRKVSELQTPPTVDSSEVTVIQYKFIIQSLP